MDYGSLKIAAVPSNLKYDSRKDYARPLGRVWGLEPPLKPA